MNDVFESNRGRQQQGLDQYFYALGRANVRDEARAQYLQINEWCLRGAAMDAEVAVALASKVWRTPEFEHLKPEVQRFVMSAADRFNKPDKPSRIDVGLCLAASYMCDRGPERNPDRAKKYAQKASERCGKENPPYACPAHLVAKVAEQKRRTEGLFPTGGWFARRPAAAAPSELPAIPESLRLGFEELDAEFSFR